MKGFGDDMQIGLEFYLKNFGEDFTEKLTDSMVRSPGIFQLVNDNVYFKTKAKNVSKVSCKERELELKF